MILGAWGKVGINCFVLITGFFMCESRITGRKYVKLVGEVAFYQVVVALVFAIPGRTPLSLPSIVKALLPVTEARDNCALWGRLTLAAMLASTLSVVACAAVMAKIGRGAPYLFVTDSNTFLAVADAVCAFLWFKSLPVRQSAAINTVASTTFGVLLMHSANDAMRQWLWKDVIDCVGNYAAPLMPLYALACVAAVFTACSCLDLLRIRMIEAPFMRWWDCHEKAIMLQAKGLAESALRILGA